MFLFHGFIEQQNSATVFFNQELKVGEYMKDTGKMTNLPHSNIPI